MADKLLRAGDLNLRGPRPAAVPPPRSRDGRRRSATTPAVHAPFTGAKEVTVRRVTGGDVVHAHKEGPPGGPYEHAEIIATTPADRDRLVDEFLGEG
jgi:hypothetical protein